MIHKRLLEILSCPLDPSRTRLVLEGDHFTCPRCLLQFKIRDGFPVLLVDEAVLPPGCDNVGQLPCQKENKPPPKA
jgi:hypothetical protein